MEWSFVFVFNSLLLGVGLAMDAFSVSLANGLSDPGMKPGRACGIAGIFGFFQALMPLLGWVCVHTILQYFSALEALIPWIALGLLSYIGGKMIYESLRGGEESQSGRSLGLGTLLMQGVATSIDALSVGFTIAEYELLMALACAGIIAAVTFVICLAGLYIGRAAGTRLAGKAGLLGGGILIFIGLEIFVSSFL